MIAGRPLLQVRGLRVHVPGPDGRRVDKVAGIDLEVGENEFVSIVGESGSGKTLTVMSLCALTPPGVGITGSAVLSEAGREPTELIGVGPEVLRSVRGARIGYVFQDPLDALDPVRRCGLQVADAYAAHSRKSRADAAAVALRALKRTGLPDPHRVYEAYPHELSGGMRQRVALAAALIAGPRLLVADEPTTALDAQSRSQVLSLLDGLRADVGGLSVLLVTHDITLARKHSNRIYVLNSGRVEEVLGHEGGFKPVSAYARRLFSADPSAHAPRTRIPV